MTPVDVLVALLGLVCTPDPVALGSPSWHERERTTAYLVAHPFGARAAARLAGADDPEVRARAAYVVDTHARYDRDAIDRLVGEIDRAAGRMLARGDAWVNADEADFWADPKRFAVLNAAAVRRGLVVCRHHQTGSPDAVRELANYCRALTSGEPGRWSWPWAYFRSPPAPRPGLALAPPAREIPPVVCEPLVGP